MTAHSWTPPPQPGPPIVITPRLAQVLTCLCVGLTTRQIARQLGITENTVKSHAKSLILAASAKDRVHLVAVAAVRQVIVNDSGRRAWWAA